MSGRIGAIIRAWDRFWFAEQATDTIGLYRIYLGTFVFFHFMISLPNVERFYGALGIIDYDFFINRLDELSWQTNHHFSLLSISSEPWLLWLVYAAGVLSALSFTLGYMTQVSTVVLFATFTSFFHRNPYLLNGQECLVNMLLFFSCCTPMGESYSLDALRRRSTAAKGSAPQEQTVYVLWGWRLMQVSLSLMYLFGGLIKLADPAWLDGTAIYYLSLDDEWFRFPYVDLLHNETLCLLQTYAALLVEILFPFLVWVPKTKIPAILCYLILHTLIIIFLAQSITYFNILLVGTLVLYLPPQTTRRSVDSVIKLFASRRLAAA